MYRLRTPFLLDRTRETINPPLYEELQVAAVRKERKKNTIETRHRASGSARSNPGGISAQGISTTGDSEAEKKNKINKTTNKKGKPFSDRISRRVEQYYTHTHVHRCRAEPGRKEPKAKKKKRIRHSLNTRCHWLPFE